MKLLTRYASKTQEKNMFPALSPIFFRVLTTVAIALVQVIAAKAIDKLDNHK